MISMMKIERVKRGISQPKLESRTNIPQWRISLIERGIVATSEEIEKIAAVIGVDSSDLFLGGRVKSYEA